MNRIEILKFIGESKPEYLTDYFNKSYDKLKELHSRLDKFSLYLILIVFIHFIVSGSSISSFEIGPVTVSDISIINTILPVLFAYVVFDIVVTSNHRREVFLVVKSIYLINFKKEVSNSEFTQIDNDFLTRVVMPFSFSNEIYKYFNKTEPSVSGCVGLILVLPLVSLIGLPFYFEYYMLKQIYLTSFDNLLGKASFFISIWIMLYVIFHVISGGIAKSRGKM